MDQSIDQLTFLKWPKSQWSKSLQMFADNVKVGWLEQKMCETVGLG